MAGEEDGPAKLLPFLVRALEDVALGKQGAGAGDVDHGAQGGQGEHMDAGQERDGNGDGDHDAHQLDAGLVAQGQGLVHADEDLIVVAQLLFEIGPGGLGHREHD